MDRPNDLHAELAQRILSHIRTTQLPAGHHLTEQSLQKWLGTSRGPIRGALAQLEGLGFLQRRPNRGFAIAPAALASGGALPRREDQLYELIARDRLAGTLADQISETELARRYQAPRHRLSRVLDRIAAEGWIEKRAGHGWAFLALINSAEAYRECYDLRRMLEPAAMLSPSFRVDPAVLESLERQQRFVHDEGFATLGAIELFEVNSRFHEGLAALSGNRFVVQAIQRQNQLRRLVEYRRPAEGSRTRRVCEEHLGILAELQAGAVDRAAAALAAHLDRARAEKTA